MSSDSFKQDLFIQFARVGKALANSHRLELLEFIAQGERSVEELANISGLSFANASQHLLQLRQAGLVSSTKKGLRVFYQLSDDDVTQLLLTLRNVAERHLADVQRLVNNFLTVKDDLEPIPATELLNRARDGSVTVLDVRPPEEYRSGHVPGAINVPLPDLEKYMANLDKTQNIIAYCRGPHCILAFDAVENLRKNGITAHRMEDGFPEWKSAGLPVEL